MTATYRALALSALLVVSLVGFAAAPAAASHGGDTADCEFPLTVTDDTGTGVTLDEPAETVVALDAASAQTFWEVNASDRVVGMPVRSYTEYLNGSRNRTAVLNDDGSVNVETVVELDADLVVAPNYVQNATIQQLRDANQTVYRAPFESSFEAIYAKTELYGHFVGNCEAGARTADETRNEVESIREAVSGEDSPRVLYYFYGTVAGEGTFIGDMVETAGGTNLAAEAGITSFQQISDETIVEQNPDWIVSTDDTGAINTSREPFQTTTAVQNDQVLRVDADLVSQAAPRVVEPLRVMAEAFHPEAFAEGTETETATGSETATATETDSEGDGAGFGVAVAIGALLGASFLARRR
ncbi:ABC transporter substrate-binding protein [Natronomonas halophila]|uniref:PGF-CTERM-anchored ABC transporter substrate-binding protein n=1 Tax=Natronomonas halophila TaxID=2747817 RepID=UPI0015B68B58|nr:PGF-CTERM-anchored ABC transporter substrate-binding protein [Natronomonas halophila]QLD84945.1 ABC transporter substrate-binding protein [Natronomonas halophila]